MANPTGRTTSSVVGRDRPLERLTRAVLGTGSASDPDGPTASAFLVTGDPGIGKSVLLGVLGERAEAAGALVIVVPGRADASLTAFDGLRRVLRPLRTHAAQLPGRLGATVRAVVDDVPVEGEPLDLALLCNGVLALLADAGAETRLLVCVDDLDLLDGGSRDVLLAVTARLDSAADERVTVVFAQRGAAVAGGGAEHLDVVDLGPLDDADAIALLDRVPRPPQGRRRLEVLRCAAGNPLALVELARLTDAAPLTAGPDVTALPLSTTLVEVFGRQLAALPVDTRSALLFVAVGEDRLTVLETAPVGIDPAAWSPAEDAELAVVVEGHVRFRHPLVQSAVLQFAGAPARRAAHGTLVRALAHEPGRRAWHLSVGHDTLDEDVAVELAAYAESTLTRGDAVGAATVLERSAAIGEPGLPRARRLLRAAELAGTAGQVAWVFELADTAERECDDPAVHIQAAALAGWALVMGDRAPAALERLLVLERLTDRGLRYPGTLVFTATLPTYTLGDDAAYDRLRAAMHDVFAETLDGVTPASLPAPLLFPAATVEPDDAVVDRLVATPDPPAAISDATAFIEAAAVGASAYVVDETRVAVRQLTPVVATLRRGRAQTPALTSFGALGWSLIDAGLWRRAAENAVESLRVNTVPRLPIVHAVAAVQLAIVTALGGTPAARAGALHRAETAFDPTADPALAAHLALLRSRVATADGDLATSWAAVRRLFTDDGRPAHRHITGLALGDVVSVGRATGFLDEALALVEPQLAATRWRSVRQSLVDARARALCDDDAVTRMEALGVVAAHPAAGRWPLERALTLLDLAEAARRSRRPAAARDALAGAVDVFERLGAPSFEDRCRRELRAAGVQVDVGRTPTVADLTDQQRQIVAMAAEGLTNREIGQAMFLSPRTVGSHLYRAFPKLGVTSRAQLPTALATLRAAEPDEW